MIRARIMEAIEGLSARQVQMEQCYQDNHTYAPTSGCAACATATAKDFQFACEGTPTTTEFTLKATGLNTMSGFSYTVDQSNAKGSAIASPAPSGWVATSNTCWITNKGGAC
ncbi:MAG: pilus assembly protein PilE [Candidatus Accumulibacter sp.]|nr:pilus assembly protein PilE [Accumulibacter sp.]